MLLSDTLFISSCCFLAQFIPAKLSKRKKKTENQKVTMQTLIGYMYLSASMETLII